MIDTATWWNPTEGRYDDFIRGLNHVNAIAYDEYGEYENLHRALMKFGIGMNFSPDRQVGQENGPGDGATMRKFMNEASESYLTEKFYLGSAFRNLNEIEPPIHDVYEAYKLRISTPNASNAEIIKKASRVHESLRSSTDRYDERRNVANRKKVGKDLGALLYLVRCNISHGHKMGLGGSNDSAIERDRKINELGLRVLRDIVRRILAEPQHRLAVYGTLRRSQSNHDQIADLGEPKIGIIKGSVKTVHDFPVFKWTHDGENIPVEVYNSSKLTDGRWRRLNEFEGTRYRRMLIPVRFEDGTFQVATTYCLNPATESA